jgi:hypothetical protein
MATSKKHLSSSNSLNRLYVMFNFYGAILIQRQLFGYDEINNSESCLFAIKKIEIN